VKYSSVLYLWSFIVCVGCAGAPVSGPATAGVAVPAVSSQYGDLEKVIETAAVDIKTNLRPDSVIAVFSCYSPSERLSEYIVEELSAYLVNTRVFNLVERKYLDEVRKELKFQLSGEVSDESAQSIGKMLGAQYIIVGSFERSAKHWTLRTTTIGVETAKKEVISSGRVNLDDEDVAYLLTNATPRNEEEDIKSALDGTWRSGLSLWTFDNNNFTLELENGVIVSGTFMYTGTDLNMTMLKYKENIYATAWQTFNPPEYNSFQYAVSGNKLFLDGYFAGQKANTTLTKE
jgi:TolB-like protein